MSNLQIKDVPPELHAELRRRARASGMSLRDYVLRVLQDEARLPAQGEWLDELLAQEPIDTGGLDIAGMIREQRAEREAEILRGLGLEPDADR